MTSVWVASRTFAREQPEAVDAWRNSMRDAIEYLETNESDARAMMQDWLKIPAQVLDRAPLPDWDVDISPESSRRTSPSRKRSARRNPTPT